MLPLPNWRVKPSNSFKGRNGNKESRQGMQVCPSALATISFTGMSIICSTPSIGNAIRALSLTQQSALQILSVRGRRIVKVVPLPRVESV